MDDQRDYAEERANLLLMHEECEGCETCKPDNSDIKRIRDEADYLYKHLTGVQTSTKLDNWNRADIIDDLVNLLTGCTWDTKY